VTMSEGTIELMLWTAAAAVVFLILLAPAVYLLSRLPDA